MSRSHCPHFEVESVGSEGLKTRGDDSTIVSKRPLIKIKFILSSLDRLFSSETVESLNITF